MSTPRDGGRNPSTFGGMRTALATAASRVQPRLPRRFFRSKRDRWALSAGAALIAAVLIAGGVLLYQAAHAGKRITAMFTETIGVYPGSTVRVLGVAVGSVDSVRPAGSQVAVTMTLRRGVAVPAVARAVIIAPSVVADRYVQLTPAYTGGPQIADGAVIPASRTLVPAEIDQVYAGLDRLATALGPRGANSHGALSKLIRAGAANLAGNGANLHAMITQLSGLARTLGGSSGNLFGTVGSLQRFTAMLKANDGQVRLAERQLAQVASFLAADRSSLAGALNTLATALGQVRGFIAGNRALIKSNVGKLAVITSLLVKERASLAEALDTAPLAADNLVGAYDAAHRALDSRGNLLELLAGAHLAVSGPAAAPGGPGGAPPGSVAVTLAGLAALPPLPLPPVGPVYGTPGAVTAGGQR